MLGPIDYAGWTGGIAWSLTAFDSAQMPGAASRLAA